MWTLLARVGLAGGLARDGGRERGRERGREEGRMVISANMLESRDARSVGPGTKLRCKCITEDGGRTD